MKSIFKIILSFFLLTITCNVNASSQKLTIGLDWFINPDHAPLIIAKKRNFFRDLNLEVEMIEPADPNDPPKLVADITKAVNILKWKPRQSKIDTIISSAWKWHSSNRNY